MERREQRILQILGTHYNSKLVTVQEQTDYMNTFGFVGKPDAAKKTRGDQYLFVNNRFIRSAYLNHAIMSAFQDLIPSDSFPLYVLFIELDPVQVDVNVHPTKQEIKFEDEKIVYAFVQAAVKHALAQFSITPTLDFDLDPSIQHLDAVSKPVSEEKKASVASSSLYQSFTQKNQAHFIEKSSNLGEWKSFFTKDERPEILTAPAHFQFEQPVTRDIMLKEDCTLIQVFNTYILAATNRGFVLVHQQHAHERVLYEKLAAAAAGKPVAYQRSLFPSTIELSKQDAVLLEELLDDLLQLGYLVEPFGKDTFVIQGSPADLDQGNERMVVENLLEQVDDVPQIRDDVFTMERNTNRLIALINQILDFRQTETKGFSIDFVKVNITQLLKESHLNFATLAKKRALQYSIETPANDLYAFADEEALNKIFSNLLSNAIKYAQKKVTIKLVPPLTGDNKFIIEIENDGMVIPDELKEKIFEPFYRLKESFKHQGTGLGLALARSLTELHQGHLDLQNTSSGLNKFVLCLPLKPAEKNRKNRHKRMLKIK